MQRCSIVRNATHWVTEKSLLNQRERTVAGADGAGSRRRPGESFHSDPRCLWFSSGTAVAYCARQIGSGTWMRRRRSRNWRRFAGAWRVAVPSATSGSLDRCCEAHDYQTQGNSLLTVCSYSGNAFGNVARRILSSCPIFFKRITTPNNNAKDLTSPTTRTIPATATRKPK